MALPESNQQPAPKSMYSHVQGSKAVTIASPQPVARCGNIPGAVAARTRTRVPLQTPPPGKVLAVHESRTAAVFFLGRSGLFRGVRMSRARRSFAAAAAKIPLLYGQSPLPGKIFNFATLMMS